MSFDVSTGTAGQSYAFSMTQATFLENDSGTM